MVMINICRLAQVDQVYFPQLEVVGDVGNAIWRISEAIKSKPPSWDLRCDRPSRSCRLGHLCRISRRLSGG